MLYFLSAFNFLGCFKTKKSLSEVNSERLFLIKFSCIVFLKYQQKLFSKTQFGNQITVSGNVFIGQITQHTLTLTYQSQ